MKFATVVTKTGPATVVIDADGVLRGLPCDHDRSPGTLDEIVRGGVESLRIAEAVLLGAPRVHDVETFLPPLSKSKKILCVGINYAQHARESNREHPVYPIFFARFTTSLVGHRRPIIRPAVSHTLDFEGELVAVIGRKGKSIPKDRALDHVVGYSIFNDGSIREYQFKTSQFTIGKNFDRTGAFGPYLVPSQELPAGASGLQIETRLNGTIMQSARTSDMIFDVASLVSIVSEAITLEPGDLIVTGTPAGVGYARNPKIYLGPGDTCEVEIEGIGVLSNPIVDEQGPTIDTA
jgi:acylpyruvate hydrolase